MGLFRDKKEEAVTAAEKPAPVVLMTEIQMSRMEKVSKDMQTATEELKRARVALEKAANDLKRLAAAQRDRR